MRDSEREIVNAIINAISLGLQICSYLEVNIPRQSGPEDRIIPQLETIVSIS